MVPRCPPRWCPLGDQWSGWGRLPFLFYASASVLGLATHGQLSTSPLAESSWGLCPPHAAEAAPAPAVWLGKVPRAGLSWKGQTQGQGRLRARQEKVLGKRWHDAECQDMSITCSLRLQSAQRRAACTVLPGECLLPRFILSHPAPPAGLY